MPGRTDNEIKNYWNTHIRKRLLRNGIDPVTHSTRLDLMDLSSIFNSAQLKLSNILNLQTLVNPDVISLATLLASSSNQGNQELFLNNQINHMNQTLISQHVPINCSFIHTSLTSTHLSNQESQSQYLSSNLVNMNDQIGNEDMMPPCLPDNHGTLLNHNDQFQKHASKIENNYIPPGHNFNFDSVLSTPTSRLTPLNSSSTLVNSSNTEDDRDTYCSMFKFEIPEGFEFDDFIEN